jgi:hypothetical protein
MSIGRPDNPVLSVTQTSGSEKMLPALIVHAGERASRRFVEFFTDQHSKQEYARGLQPRD